MWPFRKPKTHDYCNVRGWGHDYQFTPIDDGQKGSMVGWGHGIKKGDFLLLQNGGWPARYVVDSIHYFNDPPDMWRADVSFAPRS